MSTDIDMGEVKRAVASKLVALLTGPHSTRLLSVLTPDEQSTVKSCRGEILTCMAETVAGLEHSDFWVFTFDMAFDRSTQFSHPVFKKLCSQQDAAIAEAAKDLFKFKEMLEKHTLETGPTEHLVDEESKRRREFLEERVEMFEAGLEYACRIGKVMQDFVWALDEVKRGGESATAGILWNL